jgi:F0F1-type ATP synthase epsilon subunit
MLRALSRTALRPTGARLSLIQTRFFAEDARVGTAGSAVQLTFATPYEVLANKEGVEWVSLPGSGGVFGVYPDHVPLITDLKPGVVSISRKGVVSKHFVSGGFAFVRKGSVVDVSVPEAVPVSSLDGAAAKLALDENLRAAALPNASPEDKAIAEINAEVNQAIVFATNDA